MGVGRDVQVGNVGGKLALGHDPLELALGLVGGFHGMEHRHHVVGELLAGIDHVVLGLGALLNGGYLAIRAVGEDPHEARQLGVPVRV